MKAIELSLNKFGNEIGYLHLPMINNIIIINNVIYYVCIFFFFIKNLI